MTTSLKTTAKEVREVALQLTETYGMLPDELSSRTDALLLIAVAALKEIEADESSSLEVATAAKSARHTLRPHVPRNQQEKVSGTKRERVDEISDEYDSNKNNNKSENSAKNQDEIDLGQYANTDVFDGNTKKRTKFARLMGGGKHEGTHHNTFVADKGTLKSINGALEEQFNNALSRHGKKGLGA
ncbi:Small acidic protein-like domain [Trypanosoma melophagium]|uniref:Small acidic protein-like domain n=1 Tax=Trypanosoma melophagium TaxID=715481 RepID=UPI00351A7C31|nr:Small acidic protein-like domain [Trypanosoma melophagium]